MDYEKNQLNPLVVVILQVLKSRSQPLGIHELLVEIKAISPLPQMDDDEQLALFKLNWLMMNALYHLQAALIADGFHLSISTLSIVLLPLDVLGQTNTEQMLEHQPLRDFYWDWNNFSNTTADEVQAMLEGVWQAYLNPDQQRQAFAVLELESTATWLQIKKAYRQQAALHHPDKGGDAQCFMAARQAYECLKQHVRG